MAIKKPYREKLVYYLDDNVLQAVDRYASCRNISRSQAINEILVKYLIVDGYEPLPTSYYDNGTGNVVPFQCQLREL
jgi:hypothetical protein